MNELTYINISLDIFCGIVCLVILLFAATSEYRKVKQSRIFIRIIIVNILLLFTDAAVCILDGSPSSKAHFPLVVMWCLIFIYGPIHLAFFTEYVLIVIKKKAIIPKAILHAAYTAVVISAADISYIIIKQFNHLYFMVDENNHLNYQGWFFLSQVFSFVCIVLNTGIVIAYRKKLSRREFLTLLSYTVILSAAIAINISFQGFSVINFSITLVIILYFAGIQSELSKQIKQKELELTKSKVAVMLSQIQPHFLYNSLTAIAQLCDENPAKAKKTTIDFSAYLRSNMNSLSDMGLISFEKELDHVKAYLNLEQAIYGKALNVVFNIETADFFLPPLTVQPIVENAVKHGIGQREGGGTVTVSACETDKEYLVTVSDDGMGYDINKPYKDKRTHIGIDNVRQRLMEQCGGMLEFVSEVGSGTIAAIRIPKKY